MGRAGKSLGGMHCPIMVAGDFNQVLSREEKFSANTRSIAVLNGYKISLKSWGLSDLWSFGVFYTWTNNRLGDEATYEKLDRAMANKEWKKIFPKAAMLSLPIQRSDHSPVVIDTYWHERPRYRPKRFEEVWLRDDGVTQIISRVWGMRFSGSLSFQLVQKQNVLMRHLRNWGNLSYGSMRRKMLRFGTVWSYSER